MFYVKSQNATIVARHRGTGVVFECFEVLPKTDAVMKAKDALVRSFPARAVFLPNEIMETKVFVEELGTAIHKLSIEQLKQSMETTTKGGNVVAEDRQSPSPRLVSEWLFGAVLSNYGSATPLYLFLSALMMMLYGKYRQTLAALWCLALSPRHPPACTSQLHPG